MIALEPTEGDPLEALARELVRDLHGLKAAADGLAPTNRAEALQSLTERIYRLLDLALATRLRSVQVDADFQRLIGWLVETGREAMLVVTHIANALRERRDVDRRIDRLKEILGEVAEGVADSNGRPGAVSKGRHVLLGHAVAALEDVKREALEAISGRGRQRQAGRRGAAYGSLTPTQQRLVDELATGDSLGEIAKRLYYSPNTLKTMQARIAKKLKLKTSARMAILRKTGHVR